MRYSNYDKAKKLITYAVDEAPTLQDAVDAFNNCASSIKSCTYSELCSAVDEYLA